MEYLGDEAERALAELVPPYMQEGIRRYILDGVPPGDFLSAVICNDLKRACEKADAANAVLLYNYVKWFWNFAPLDCWGSESNYHGWIDGKAKSRAAAG